MPGGIIPGVFSVTPPAHLLGSLAGPVIQTLYDLGPDDEPAFMGALTAHDLYMTRGGMGPDNLLEEVLHQSAPLAIRGMESQLHLVTMLVNFQPLMGQVSPYAGQLMFLASEIWDGETPEVFTIDMGNNDLLFASHRVALQQTPVLTAWKESGCTIPPVPEGGARDSPGYWVAAADVGAQWLGT